MTQSGNNRYPWYVLFILTFAQTCHGIDRAIIGLVLHPVGVEFDLTGEELGILAGLAYGAAFAFAAIPFGYAVDRLNRKNLMTFALSAWSAATVVCGFAVGFWSLFLGRAAVGIAEAGGSPTGMSILSDYFAEHRRATVIGIWYLSAGLGLGLAFLIGGWIVEHYNWRWAFVAAGIPGLLLAPLLFLTVREPTRGRLDIRQERDVAVAPLRKRLLLLLMRPGMTPSILAVTCIAAGIYGMSTWLTTFLVDSHQFSMSQAGLTVAISYGVLGSVGGIAAGWFTDRVNAGLGGFDPARTAMLAALIPTATAIGGIGVALSTNVPLVLGFIMLAGLFSSSFNGPVFSVVMALAGPQLRGLAVSVVQLTANLVGVGFGAWLIGKVSDLVGGEHGVAWGIGTAMLFCLLGGIFLLLASYHIRREIPINAAQSQGV